MKQLFLLSALLFALVSRADDRFLIHGRLNNIEDGVVLNLYEQAGRLKGNQWNKLRSGRTGLAATYQVQGIPHYVLISPEGKVLKMWSGYGEGSLQRMIEKYL